MSRTKLLTTVSLQLENEIKILITLSTSLCLQSQLISFRFSALLSFSIYEISNCLIKFTVSFIKLFIKCWWSNSFNNNRWTLVEKITWLHCISQYWVLTVHWGWLDYERTESSDQGEELSREREALRVTRAQCSTHWPSPHSSYSSCYT